MIWLLALAFGIGGSLIVMLGFSRAFDRETESALRATRMVLNTLKIVDQIDFPADHPFLNHFHFLKELAGDAAAKQCIPSPSMLHLTSEKVVIWI